MMTVKKENISKVVWYLLVFGFLLVWFTRIKPLMVYNGDDWLYLSYSRLALPVWNDWNPSRVLQEVLMPLCGAVAAYVVTPLTGDYVGAVTLVSALVVSGCITVYVCCFDKLMDRLFSLSAAASIMLSGLFLILHFLVFRGDESGNSYLFYCWDLNCYYCYLIPALLNSSLVMYMTANPGYPEFLEKGSWEKKGLFLMAVYFAIFSNLPASVILAIWAGARVLVELVKNVRKHFDWKVFLKNNAVPFAILMAWIISAVFELGGGRAVADMGYRKSLGQALKETAYGLFIAIKGNNNLFILFAVVVMAAAAVMMLRSGRKEEQGKKLLALVGELLICILVIMAALIVLCAVVDISYITRSEYLFGLYFFGFLLLMTAFGWVLQKQPKGLAVLPILLCVLVSDVHTSGNTFLDSNLQNFDAEVCETINNDIIDQITAAVEAGQEEMVLHVPNSGRSDNWPHAEYVGNSIANTLYEHGIIPRSIEVITEPDLAMNEKYTLPIPEVGEG